MNTKENVRYHECKREMYRRFGYMCDISPSRMFVIADMAMNNVYPDGRFSDEECCIWEGFRSMFRTGGIMGNTSD